MLYSAYFPYDTTQSRGFLPTWLSQFFLTILSMVGYSGPDSLIAMMTLHLCGQLATVRIALTNIVDEECIEDPSIYWKRLSSIIQRHEELNRFSFIHSIHHSSCNLQGQTHPREKNAFPYLFLYDPLRHPLWIVEKHTKSLFCSLE